MRQKPVSPDSAAVTATPVAGRVSERTKQAPARVHNSPKMKIQITKDVPKYARLTRGVVVDAEPVADHPGLMRVKGFGAFENGALVRGWELVLPDEELWALLNEG